MPLNAEYPLDLLEPRTGPCLSLYQPTHRWHPDNQQDPIRFRNLLRVLEGSLAERCPEGERETLLAPFRNLADDRHFWTQSLDGIAAFGAQGEFQVRRLQRSVPELALVADSFHLKPLLRIAQSADRYQILGVSREAVRLFEGTRDALDEVPLAPGVPRTVTDALGGELTEPHVTVASYNGPGGPAMHHGHGSRKDEVDVDRERFFRVIDRAILDHHSRVSQLPLLLAALPEHHADFTRVSHNPYLLPETIDVSPDAVPLDLLRQRAWQVMGPRYRARLRDLIDRFETARAHGRGAEDLEAVASAIPAGRIGVLLVEADRRIPGRFDATTGRIEYADGDRPDVDDLLDDLGEQVLARKGEVIVVPAADMPTRTGVAATFRY
jgi:hypothetical protein